MRTVKEGLDESLWKELPTDILQIILLRLPLAKVMQFKTVCKDWRDLLAFHSYYRRRYRIQSREPWFFLCTSGKFSFALDFTLQRWHRIPSPPIYRQAILCTAGNLVCLGNLVADCRVLSVGDPLKKLFKRLPPMNKIQFIHKVSMHLHREEDLGLLSYKIMVAGEDDLVVDITSPKFGGLLTEVYDSKAGIWKMSAEPLPQAKFGLDAGVWLQNRFYCIVEMPYGIVIFDESRGVWEELKAGMPAGGWNDVASPSLLECKGRLLMVVRNSKDSSSAIQIWELLVKEEKGLSGRSEHEWRILEEVPEHFRVEFMGCLECNIVHRIICCGVGDWVCIMSHLNPRVLGFNLVSKRWEWLPKDPSFPHARSYYMLAFPLDPFSQCEL